VHTNQQHGGKIPVGESKHFHHSRIIVSVQSSSNIHFLFVGCAFVGMLCLLKMQFGSE